MSSAPIATAVTRRTIDVASPSDLRSAIDSPTRRAPLYAVLDAARAPEIPKLLEQGHEPYASLFGGASGRRLAHVAPYLVLLGSDRSATLGAIEARGWGRSWGIFLVAPLSLAEVRRHLRRFLTIETDDGEALSFRFYDPRVTRPFVSSCTGEEIARFFGPLGAVLFEEREDIGVGVPPRLVALERSGPALIEPRAPRPLHRIRAAQLEVFADAIANDLVGRVSQRLSGTPPSVAAAIIARAERHGLGTTDEIERFVDLARDHGADFDTELPWARNLLALTDLQPAQRLARLERRSRSLRSKSRD